MGNIASYFSENITLEGPVFGQTSQEKPTEVSNETPTRCTKLVPGNQLFDPRSPTFDIDRTPIVFEVESEDERQEDPRSPSFGITRTPVIPVCVDVNMKAVYEKEREDLIQVLNFADLDCLSLSNIEEDASLISEEPPTASATIDDAVAAPVDTDTTPSYTEETYDFSSFVITSSSTPRSSPVKPSGKPKRPVNTNNVVTVDENCFGKSNSPMNGGNSLLGRPRVPFGDVNRPVLASPRLQLQNKQRRVVRTGILQHQQRYSNKNE
ncbi:uncharacterized protein LOC130701664 [Daphnia carinata]|uniref:uncharacterized protein LOC130701664 n=1 Tax=Daphnia carinata TaxID=120202 RepID=UPI0025796A7F|nr:uncharacterized protein LOC130701664 [Daphnia carinata]